MKHLLLLVFFLPIYCLAQSHTPAPYCLDKVSTYTKGTAISKVKFNTLSNALTYPIPQADAVNNWWGYTYYDNIAPTIVHTDSTYTLSVSFDYQNTYTVPYYSVWIDYNHNNVFDSAEVVLSNAVLGTLPADTVTITAAITIPPGAYIGNTRMRIARHDIKANFYGAYQLLPCYAGYAGEKGNIQDYNITITDTIPPADTTIDTIPPAFVPTLSSPEIIAYPNPSKGVFNVGYEKIDLTGWPAGVYIRRIGNKYYKLVKE